MFVKFKIVEVKDKQRPFWPTQRHTSLVSCNYPEIFQARRLELAVAIQNLTRIPHFSTCFRTMSPRLRKITFSFRGGIHDISVSEFFKKNKSEYSGKFPKRKLTKSGTVACQTSCDN